MHNHLTRALVLALSMSLAGCVYVTKAEYDALWDEDEDGWPIDDDCDDTNADVYPFAPDYRGDGCDADCGRELDSDGDDWPDQADCAPQDPESHPCSTFEVAGDGIDHDCDGRDTPRTDSCPRIDPDYETTLQLDENCQRAAR